MEDYKNLMKELVGFKSISTSSDFQADIQKTVAWLQDLFADNDFKVKVLEGYDNPVLLASYQVNSNFETALVYGHYDVQPADKSEGWDSDPFELSEKDGRLYGRGVVDNKGQVFVHIKTILDLISEDKLKYNVKFLLEGNEETGSPNLKKCLIDNKELLDSDFIMISDGEITGEHPTIEAGFRGGFNSTLTISTSDKELHSGLFGGAAPSASRELTKLLAKIYKEDNSVAIDGFYDNVDEVTEDLLKLHEKVPFSMEEYKKLSGTKALLNEESYDLYTQIGLRPAVIVTGLEAGYTGKGYRNSIPNTARAKVNFRLVKSQNPDKIGKFFREFVKKELPDYVDFKLKVEDPYDGIKLDLDNKYVETARSYLTDAFGAEALVKFCGGGLPIVTHFNEVLGVPQILAPLANEDCAMHAANENYDIEILEKAMEFSRMFWNKE